MARKRAPNSTHKASRVAPDHTARTRAEAALRESEQRFSLAFHAAPIAMAITAIEDGCFVEVNDAQLRLLGYSREEIVGHSSTDVHLLSNASDHARVLEIVEREGSLHDFETTFRTKSGELRDVTLSVVPITLHGAPHLLGTVIDETDRRRALAALDESERRLRLFIEHAPAALAMFDREMRYVAVSRRWVTDYRLGGQAVIGRSHYDVFPDIPARWKDAHRRGLQGEVVRAEQDRFERADGTVQWLRWEIRPWPGVDGAVAGIVIFTEDISKQKAAEAALRESEGRFAVAFQKAPFAAVLSRVTDGAIVEVNEEFERVFSFSKQEVVGRTSVELDLYPVKARERLIAEFSAKGSVRALELSVIARSGEQRALLVSSDVVQIGGQEYVLSTAHDVTERKRAEEALRESRQREQQAVSAGNVGLWDWDLRSNKVYFSSEWKRQIGYADDEISDDFSEWQSRLHPDDLDRCLETVQTFLADPGHRLDLDFRFHHKDGSYRNILARGSLQRDEQGQPVRLLGSHLDVTEWTQLQAQFLQAQKMESVGRLAGGIAHDFNNLLTVINGIADLTLDDLHDGDPLRADIQQIRQAGDRAALLTRQLLAFSRRQVWQPEVVSLNTIVDGMQSMLRRLIGEDVSLLCDMGEDLGCVLADPGQIEQVLLNLAVNARDAMARGGTLTIVTRNVQLDAATAGHHEPVSPGRYVVLSVRDTGVGMNEATRARAFEPFFTTKGPSEGTGLGLSTVYGIVKQSGGGLTLHSEIGKGTSFSVFLPVVEAPADSARSPRSSAATPASGAETVMIVEDEAELRGLAARVLESAGYKVLVAANADQALLMLEPLDRPVHLVLTDVVMPGMSGRELADRLRLTHPQVKVLYSSGYMDDTLLRHALPDDASHFIAKPYSPADLTRRVREVLDLKT